MASPARLIGLVSLIALLAWTVREASWSPQPLPTPTAPDTPAAVTMPNEAGFAAPLSDYGTTLSRPLFYANRQPPVADGATEETPGTPAGHTAGQAPRLSLSAVIVEDGQRSALLSAPGQATSTRLREGDSLAGWRLVTIAEDRVTVESDGRQEELLLRRFDSAPPPPPPQANQPTVRPPRVTGGFRDRGQPE